jgi:hypothetical protein
MENLGFYCDFGEDGLINVCGFMEYWLCTDLRIYIYIYSNAKNICYYSWGTLLKIVEWVSLELVL